MKRFISLMLILLMTVTLLASCKSAPADEDAAVTDDWVGVVEEDDKDGEENKKPSEDNDKTPSKPSEEDGDKKPSEDQGNDKKPADENQTPADKEPVDGGNKEPADKTPSDGEENNGGDEDSDNGSDEEEKEPEPMTKEKSGTEIVFLSQNIKHSGGKLGTVGDGTGISKACRLPRFRTMVKKYDPDVIMQQEARQATIDFFTKDPYMSQIYATQWTWRNPDPTVAGGHQAEPILYKKSKYTLVDSGHMWTSNTPDRPSKSFDAEADYGDVNSWVKLKDKETGSVFTAYCIHYAHTGNMAQILSFQLYINMVEKMKADEYLFMGGDFNVTYRSTDKYEMMMEWDKILDLRDVAMNMYQDGLTTLGAMNGSFIGSAFDKNLPTVDNPGGGKQIDFLMAKYNPHMAIDYYGFDYGRYAAPEEGVKEGWISDHYALVVKLRIDTEPDYSQYMHKHDYGDNPVYFNRDVVTESIAGY